MGHNIEMVLMMVTLINLLGAGDIIVQGTSSIQTDVQGILGREVKRYDKQRILKKVLQFKDLKSFRLCWAAHR